MPPKSTKKKSIKGRDIDGESGKPRLTKKADEKESSAPESDEEEEKPAKKPGNKAKTKVFIFEKHEDKRISKRRAKSGTRLTLPPHLEPKEDTSTPVKSDDISPAMKMLLLTADHVTPTKVKHPGISEFIPDMHAYYKMLHALQDQMASNEYFYRIAPDYLSSITSIYYSILMTFHICRIRTNLNIASADERLFALSFEQEFKLECLPVAGPLTGFFETLGYIQPMDNFGYVCPKLPPFDKNTTIGQLQLNQPGAIRYPAIPALVKLHLDFVNDLDQYATPSTAIYWIPDFTKLTIRAADAPEYTRLIHTPGWRPPVSPIAADFDQSIRSLLSRQNQPPDPNTITLDNPANFCCMPPDEDHSWFHYFMEMAATESSFVQGGTNMSNISVRATPGMLTETLTLVTHLATNYPAGAARPALPLPANITTHAKLSAISRTGTDSEFNEGLATSFLLNYVAIHNSNPHSPELTGPWFDNAAENMGVNPPLLASSLPYTKERWFATNPTHSFPSIVNRIMHPFDGTRRF